MTRSIDASVLIAGGGPVGLTLAMDLASRGIDVIVIETRHAGEPPNVKCNQVSARSMEVFRRLGIADKIRDTGLPPEFRIDVSCCVSATGKELSRIKLPSRAGRVRGEKGDDGWWPTAEWPHRINQLFLEPLLFAHAAAQPRIRILNRTEFQEFSQDGQGVTAIVRDLDSGERITITCRYLVGCDGGRSVVRHGIGAELAGIPVVQRVQSTYFRAPKLMSLLPGEPCWMYLAFNPRRCGTMMSIDGKERWLIHNFLYNGEPEYDSVDRDWAIRSILGVGPDFEYEIISKEDWIGRRLVADRFQNGRVFIAGDAAHLWIPHAGYGMNAGIADAANLAWMLAAVLNGWAEPALLDAYQAERQPITDQVSHFAFNMSKEISQQRREISADIERDDEVGEATRARIGKEAYDLYVQQQCCGGLELRLFLRRLADHRLRRRGASGLFDGQVRVVVGAGLPRAAFLAARRPLALRRAGRGLWPDPVRQERGGGRFGRGGEAARHAARRARHRRCRAKRRSTPSGWCWCGPTGTSPGAPMPSRTIRWN